VFNSLGHVLSFALNAALRFPVFTFIKWLIKGAEFVEYVWFGTQHVRGMIRTVRKALLTPIAFVVEGRADFLARVAREAALKEKREALRSGNLGRDVMVFDSLFGAGEIPPTLRDTLTKRFVRCGIRGGLLGKKELEALPKWRKGLVEALPIRVALLVIPKTYTVLNESVSIAVRFDWLKSKEPFLSIQGGNGAELTTPAKPLQAFNSFMTAAPRSQTLFLTGEIFDGQALIIGTVEILRPVRMAPTQVGADAAWVNLEFPEIPSGLSSLGRTVFVDQLPSGIGVHGPFGCVPSDQYVV
jgi:hypothetical protein